MSVFDRGRFVTAWGIDGASLMATDAALLAAAEAAALPATLLVAAWAPSAVSLGRFQAAESAVDVERVARAGFDLVRRPTGGRAVLHRGDVTYTLVARHDDPELGGARAASLRAIAEALVAGLARLGITAERAPGGNREGWHDDAERAIRGDPACRRAVPPCFASATREEIRARGRKLVGSARLDGRRAFLQHGSLPLDARPLGLVAFLSGGERARRAAGGALVRGTISVGEILGRIVAPDEVALALRAGFETRAARPFVDEPLRADERAAARLAAPRHRIAPAAADSIAPPALSADLA